VPNFCKKCGHALSADRWRRENGLAFLLHEADTTMRAMVPEPYISTLIDRYKQKFSELVSPAATAAPAPEPYISTLIDRHEQESAGVVPPTAPVAPRMKAPPAPSAPRVPFDWSWVAEQQANLFLFAGAFLVVIAALIYVGYSGEAVAGGLKMLLLGGYTAGFLAAGVVCLRNEKVAIAGHVFLGISAILVPLNFVLAGSIVSEQDVSHEGMWFAGSLASAGFYTAVAAIGLGRPYSVASGAGLLSAALASVFLFGLPVEWAPIPFMALAIIIGVVELASPEPFKTRVGLTWAWQAQGTAVAALAFALVAALYTTNDTLEVDSRWFAAPAAALGLAFYAVQAVWRQMRIAVTGSAVTASALASSVVYGFDISPEYYAFALIAAALGIIAIARWAATRLAAIDSFARMDAVWLAHAATAGGVAVAITAAVTASEPANNYSPDTRWFLFGAFAAASLVYALHLTMKLPALRDFDPLATFGFCLAAAGAATAVVYGADWSAEYYSFAFAAGALPALALAAFGLPRGITGPSDMRLQALCLAHAAALTAGAVAVTAAVVALDPESTHTPDTRVFLPALFACLTVFYALAVAARHQPAPAAPLYASAGLLVALLGVSTGTVYALDISEEYYAFGVAAAALPALALASFGLPMGIEAPGGMRSQALALAHIAAAAAGAVAVSAVYAASRETVDYAPDTRWFLPALFGCLAAFYGLAALSPYRHSETARGLAGTGLVEASFGVTTGVVYALDVSAEYYAFAVLLPAVALGALAHAPRSGRADEAFSARWRAGAIWFGRIAAVSGLAVAVIAALVASDPDATYVPDTRVFLPLAFLAAAAFFALDASFEKSWKISMALLITLGGAGVTIAYAADAAPAYYGLALVCAGITYGFAGRVWAPAWLDLQARDLTAVTAVTAGWLFFEGAYEDNLRLGVASHLAAGLFYAGAAVIAPRDTNLSRYFGPGVAAEVPIGAAWLYAAGLTTAVGFVDLMRALPGDGDTAAADLAFPLMGLALGFLAVSAALRLVRRDFALHVYVIALLVSIASIAVAGDSQDLAAILTVFAVACLAVSAWHNVPLAAAPSVVFGLGTVIAWRHAEDWPLYVIPLTYTAAALALYSAGFAVRRNLPAWSDALRSAGAAFGLVAPAIGFGILADRTEAGIIDGEDFETSALYEWSTLATGVAGLLAIAESAVARRGWLVVGGSAVMLVAILLQIGRFSPDNIQAYTAVIGAYLVLLGLIGLSRYRLVPGLDETAVYVEALGAAIIMFPSLLQSLEGVWRYELILLVEAAGFFAAGVALRRRGLLGISIAALVLVGGRVLFDALNAVPNWIVALIIGMILLGIGLAILLGREQWTRWEERVASWWKAGPPAHPL
jgi:hypothetical protein